MFGKHFGGIFFFLICLVLTANLGVFGQYYAGGGLTDNANKACFTPDYTQGLCVPMAQCRRIAWLLQTWSPPYPEHIARYVRQSHCGTQGSVHYACCALYDVKDHHHHHHPYAQYPVQMAKPSPSPSIIHNPYHSIHRTQHLVNPPTPYASDEAVDFHERPSVSYLRQPRGEHILRSMPCGSLSGDRISNGEIVRLSEFPWMVLLESRGIKSRQRFRCAGTLITNQYVLTAGHCVEARNDVFSVRLGEHDLRTESDCEQYRKSHAAANCAPPYEDIAIESIIIHPDFKLRPMQNDIALVRLQRPVTFNSHIKPICLPLDANVSEHMAEEQIVAGWGVTENGYASNVLLKASLPLQPLDVCQRFFQQNRLDANEYLCAGGSDSRSTCRADSGGPLFAAVPYGHRHTRYVQFGITSAGSYACGGKHNLPGVYTNVASYITWITSNIY